jgi:hypothetical protein
MLYYVESGIEFTNQFGEIDEAFYNSLESVYLSTLKLLKKENLLDFFADRFAKVLVNTSGIGWDFHDNLCIMYDNYYDDNI